MKQLLKEKLKIMEEKQQAMAMAQPPAQGGKPQEPPPQIQEAA
jgi:hypothetical protein